MEKSSRIVQPFFAKRSAHLFASLNTWATLTCANLARSNLQSDKRGGKAVFGLLLESSKSTITLVLFAVHPCSKQNTPNSAVLLLSLECGKLEMNTFFYSTTRTVKVNDRNDVSIKKYQIIIWCWVMLDHRNWHSFTPQLITWWAEISEYMSSYDPLVHLPIIICYMTLNYVHFGNTSTLWCLNERSRGVQPTHRLAKNQPNPTQHAGLGRFLGLGWVINFFFDNGSGWVRVIKFQTHQTQLDPLIYLIYIT